MAKRTWPRSGLVVLLLSAATAAWTAAPGGLVPVAESRNVADYDQGYRDGYNNLPNRYQDRKHPDYAEGYRVGKARREATGAAVPAAANDDYVRGFGDGLNGKEARDRERAYRDGHRAGRSQHEANAARDDGRDYARGYRDGYNRYRERAAAPSSGNRAYAAGFRDGRTNHGTLVTGAGGQAVPPTAAQEGNLVGRPAVTLERDMKSLGFVRLARNKLGTAELTTWQSRAQKKCWRIATRDGKVQQVEDVDYGNCT